MDVVPTEETQYSWRQVAKDVGSSGAVSAGLYAPALTFREYGYVVTLLFGLVPIVVLSRFVCLSVLALGEKRPTPERSDNQDNISSLKIVKSSTNRCL